MLKLDFIAQITDTGIAFESQLEIELEIISTFILEGQLSVTGKSTHTSTG